MSDDASPTPTKRGRKSNAERAAAEKNDKAVESKKRGKKETKEVEEDGASPVKRGRGRPKGTTKRKAVKPKPKVPGRGRGRPKKKEEEAKESEEEDEEENEDGEEEEDD